MPEYVLRDGTVITVDAPNADWNVPVTRVVGSPTRENDDARKLRLFLSKGA